MIWNRSIPRATVIPVLAYLNANQVTMHTFAMLLDWFTFFAGAYWLMVIGVFTWVIWRIVTKRD
jgi:hypothetical protein